MAIHETFLPETQLRHWLGDKAGQAYDEYYESFGVRPEKIERADEIANSVADLFDIELLEPSDYGQGYYDRCDNYVFGREFGEDWYDPRSINANLWFDSLTFLQQKGFQPLAEEGSPGDVVMYGSKGGQYAEHFGIYRGDGIVDSKFAMGPLLRHPIDMIPVNYGSTYVFLRKDTGQSV